jgi:capsular polysaccharide biosynthesis protein
MIIGAFGAGLSNMIFAAAGTPVLEIGNNGKGPHYLIQAGTLGLRYYAYMCDHWRVDVDHFAHAAHFMLNDKKPP